jgi:GNAT superfamily N-acetyltransferase
MQELVRIEPVATEAYVREVLPHSHGLWGGDRTLDQYAEDFRAFANSGYGRSRQLAVGVRDDGKLVCSCKNYARDILWHGNRLAATGIGAVFTPPAFRGRGYASLMLGALLDAERAAGTDVAYLFSDIHPSFYERLGFAPVPSRTISFGATMLDGAHAGGEPLEAADWPAVHRCFEAMESRRGWSFGRTPLVWEWMQKRSEHVWTDGSQPVRLVVRRGSSILAYVLGRRSLRDDAFLFDEFGFDGDSGRVLAAPLLRAAAGDLGRVRGWLPPAVARDVLPRASVRARKDAILMVVALSPLARTWWAAVRDQTRAARADPCWSADHV